MSMLFAESSERPQLKLNKKLLLLNWPFVVLIVAIALYPQIALKRSQSAVQASIRDAKALTQPAKEASR